jgi:ATP-dependent DNA helicase DinG
MTIFETAAPDLNAKKILKLVEPDGLLSQTLKGFEFRQQQQMMMSNVIDAYNKDHITLIEAGTGTGKSLAYLIPALIWAAQRQERTVISTNTITLQEQLVNKDLPNLIAALNLKIKAVLVKGMNNYVCLRKLEDAQIEMRLFPSEEAAEIQKIEEWHRSTNDGSRSDLPFVPSPAAWDKIGAESDACSHVECPYYQQCYFFKARRAANDAQILVVNHHLLFADLFRRGDTDNYNNQSILPPYKRIILDEAHHIEDIATEYFASRLHRLELMRTLGRLSADKQNKANGKLPLLREKLQTLFNKTPPREVTNILSRLLIDLPALRRQVNDQIHETFEHFSLFVEQLNQPLSQLVQEEVASAEKKLRLLKEHQAHPKWVEEITPQTKKLIEILKQYRQGLSSIENDLKLIDNDRLQDQTKSIRFDIQALAIRLEDAIALLDAFISHLDNPNRVRWIEVQRLKVLNNIHLVDAELDVSKALARFLFSKFSTIILCSATLATNQQFDFIKHRLGLTSQLLPDRTVTEYIYDSPFDYKKQAMLVVPTDMPLPTHPDFNKTAHEQIWNILQTCRGNAFILFTSYSMLQSCYQSLAKRLEDNHFTALKQGDESRQNLLARFKKTEYSVLFGTDSFWEGVDVVGDALRCVIIVKLPFKVPSEPIIQARTEFMISKGKDPFFEYAVPNAIVKFKQGFGRLIRNKWDRGCIVCLDTRLVTKGYGKLFLNSLPPCEHFFADSQAVQQHMNQFYRKTYHFVKNNPHQQIR